MITVKRLKELLEQVPEDAEVEAYDEAEIGIYYGEEDERRWWWIRANEDETDHLTEGFEDSE